MSASQRDIRPVRSVLDSDLYKFTMQQAVLYSGISNPMVSYRFTNRSSSTMRFTRQAADAIQDSILRLADLALTHEERTWLARRCPYLRPEYLDFLAAFRFRPAEQVKVSFKPLQDDPQHGDLELTVEGLWSDVILYEVPLMSIVSETYFRLIDTRWDMRGQRALTREKARRLVSNGIRFSEFGSRRRRSYDSHRLCIEGLLQGEADVLQGEGEGEGEGEGSTSSSKPTSPGKLLGTSNVHFAQLFDLVPIGTVAHEWTMAVATLTGYDHANLRSLQYWDQVYSPPAFTMDPYNPANDLTIALTDTFSTRVFFDDVLGSDAGKEVVRRWRGLRQDSGDSKAFALKAKAVYESLGIDPKKKVVIFSDGLDVDRCIELARFSEEIGIGAGFGVGTNLTNDFKTVPEAQGSVDADADPDATPRYEGQTSKPMNIVIKIATVDGKPAVKISDDLTKNTGDADEVRLVKERFGLSAEAGARGSSEAGSASKAAGLSAAASAQADVASPQSIHRDANYLSQIVRRLESGQALSHASPNLALTISALSALEARIESVQAQAASLRSSGDADVLLTRTHLDQLSTSVHHLRQQAISQQVLSRSPLATGAGVGVGVGDADARSHPSKAAERLSPFISTSAMGRYLEESLAAEKRAKRPVGMPPAPNFEVGGRAGAGADAEDEGEGDAEDEMVAYENAAHLRRRRGYAQAGEDGGGGGGGGEDGNGDDDGYGGEKRPSEKKEKPTPHPQPPTSAPGTSSAPDRATHEALSSELLRMASLLKTQSISFGSALERDRLLLQGADDALVQNLDLMTRTRGRLGEYAHRARGMGWLTLGTVALVTATWVVMFVIIRLT